MADLLFEIGTEEIPAGFMPLALRQIEGDLAKALGDARLGHGEVKALGTPRRIAVFARDVAAKQEDARTQALGPGVAAAFDAQGNPTAAALGFAKSQGVDVSELKRIETPKGERLGVEKVEHGQKAQDVLPAILERLVAGLKFRKAMRWGDETVTFARPVRWMVALFGGKRVPVRYGDVESGIATHGHRFLAPRPITLRGSPEEYVQKLRKASVLVDPVERRALVEKELAAAAKRAGASVRPDESLVEQVNWLVEWPTAILGEFEASNLELPPEVVVSEMRNHQRYFALLADGALTNRFVAVSGTPVKDPAVARHGYERVLRARLADARFFFEEDRKRRLEDRVADLGRRTYQAKLGTELQRVERVQTIALALAEAAGLGVERDRIVRAARLAKADLGTGMVGEFPELQGIMGAHYARLEGEDAQVADAIEDHYKPVGASEEMPRGDLGAVVGAADRLHQLVGIFGVGEKVTGAADPFGLRRAALGIVRIVLDRGWSMSLRAAVGSAIDALSGVKLAQPREALEAQVLEFVRGRVKALWSERADADLVEAVLAAGGDDLVDAKRRLDALAEIKARPDFVPLAVAFKRVANIQEKALGAGAERVQNELLTEGAERDLAGELERVEQQVASLRERREYPEILRVVASLKPAVDRFFDDVLVMAEDPAVRDNRLGLMKRAGALFADIADFRKIQAELRP
ncbi:MAG TPA: glycine--tRNA ligase subunit beta [Anaeromyxobacteraceae bacterium]|nr:glycine--tRNA ligase subunit beta [Anaeromyxobacteraceae bacterium]